MKFLSTVASLFVLFGCGIMSLIFGLPERYIERDVQTDEMIGNWSVTEESKTILNGWIKQNPDWGINVPWNTFTLNNDGSCEIELQTGWLSKFDSDLATKEMKACSWSLAKEKNLSGKLSPVLLFDLEYPDNYDEKFSLYIFEQDGNLIVWDFIGDPDDFVPQDFVKVNE
jgi:hypothetical protein